MIQGRLATDSKGTLAEPFVFLDLFKSITISLYPRPSWLPTFSSHHAFPFVTHCKESVCHVFVRYIAIVIVHSRLGGIAKSRPDILLEKWLVVMSSSHRWFPTTHFHWQSPIWLPICFLCVFFAKFPSSSCSFPCFLGRSIFQAQVASHEINL